jgi:hypothetical protein
MLKKYAGFEETEVTDPKTGLTIRVSTTTRMMYRHYMYKGDPEYTSMRNVKLNAFIAHQFAESADNVKHEFKIGTSGDDNRPKAELRNLKNSTMFFVSVPRGSHIDILTIHNGWKSPKYTARYGVKK